MRNFIRPSRPVGPGPVGDVALEPRGLVRRVQEDVLRAVAVDREVVVVVHRPPVARRERAEHDRGRGDVVRELGQRVADVDLRRGSACVVTLASRR